MPTAAVIPAPIAYIKAVAVKRRSFWVMMLFARLVRESPTILKKHFLVATGLKPQASGLRPLVSGLGLGGTRVA